MKFEELKAKNEVELQALLALSREELRDAKFKASKNELKNIRSIRDLKKRISQILTLLNKEKKK